MHQLNSKVPDLISIREKKKVTCKKFYCDIHPSLKTCSPVSLCKLPCTKIFQQQWQYHPNLSLHHLNRNSSWWDVLYSMAADALWLHPCQHLPVSAWLACKLLPLERFLEVLIIGSTNCNRYSSVRTPRDCCVQ